VNVDMAQIDVENGISCLLLKLAEAVIDCILGYFRCVPPKMFVVSFSQNGPVRDAIGLPAVDEELSAWCPRRNAWHFGGGDDSRMAPREEDE
jgi:hypothetical protein